MPQVKTRSVVVRSGLFPEDPAKNAIQMNARLMVPAGNNSASVDLAVPADKRFVIEQIAIGTQGSVSQVSIDTVVHGVAGRYYFPVTMLGPTEQGGLAASVRFYCDSPEVTVVLWRDSSKAGARADGFIQLSGYLFSLI